MIFFSYQNLYFMASSDCKRIVKLLLLQEKHPIPELHGRNYIRNLEVIKDENYSYQERAEYIGICSYRNHTDELFYGKTWLDLADLPPWVPREIIENNPLINVTKETITFPFEVSGNSPAQGQTLNKD